MMVINNVENPCDLTFRHFEVWLVSKYFLRPLYNAICGNKK